MSRTCSDCPKGITAKSRTGRCLSCAAKHRFADPAARAAFAVSARRGAAKRLQRPGERERLRASIKAVRPESTPEVIAKQNAGRALTVMAWCPADYRSLNQHLRRKGIPLAERKQMIATELLREAQRREHAERVRIAAMTPFEKQMERLANGAALVPTFRASRPDPSITLGGVATGML